MKGFRKRRRKVDKRPVGVIKTVSLPDRSGGSREVWGDQTKEEGQDKPRKKHLHRLGPTEI